MVITRSAVATVSAADAAAVMPAATAAATASLLVSNAFTAKPFLTRFLAMGNPMVPTPMKPIRVMTRLLLPCESVESAVAGGPSAALLCVSYTTRAMRLGLLFIGLAAISWGTTGATMTVLARDADLGPLLVGWARLAVAAPCLLIMAAAAPRLRARPGPPPLVPSDAAAYALLGLAMAAYQVCYFRAVTLTGVAVAALLAICSAPLMIALLAALVLGERIEPVVKASLGMAVVGTALLVIGPRGARRDRRALRRRGSPRPRRGAVVCGVRGHRQARPVANGPAPRGRHHLRARRALPGARPRPGARARP